MNRSLLHGLMLVCALNTFNVYSSEKIDSDYYALGESCRQKHDYDTAITHYKEALVLNPNHFEATFNLASALYAQNKLEEATVYYKKAAELKPSCAEAHYNLGVCLNRVNDNEQALICFKKATENKADYAKAFLQLGKMLHLNKQHAEAVDAYNRVIELDKNSLEAHTSIARLYRDLEKLDLAVEHFRAAALLDPRNINALLELANTLNMFEDTAQECLELYKRALDISPNLPSALYNFGYTLKKLGHISEAVQIYDKVLEANPNYELARFSRAVSYLMLGDFERGWQEYEWRWKAYGESPLKFKQPVWDGCNLHGKKLLIYAEQGLGDTLQFIRYAKVIKEQYGAYIIFQTQRPLKTLLGRCSYIDQVVIGGDKIGDFDFQIALMSLPLLCKTRIDTVPAQVPYLCADAALVDYWQKELSKDTNFKIGICWQGNAQYKTLFLRQTVAAKSMNVSHFVPLAQVPGVSLYSLQKVNGTDQLNKLDSGIVIHQFGSDFDEAHGRFMDTAAVMKNMDLIISIDTSICHLAGGLGVPVWNLLPKPADWRWLMDQTDTPWYPNMRIIRQPKPGDWQGAMQEVVKDVTALVTTKKKGSVTQQSSTPMTQPKPVVTGQPTKSMMPTTYSNNAIDPLPTATPKVTNPLDTTHMVTLETTKQLQEVNKQLFALDQQLGTMKPSVFDQDFIELARKAYYAYNLKMHLLKQLSSSDRSSKHI